MKKFLVFFLIFALPAFAQFEEKYKTELTFIEELKPIVAQVNAEVLAERAKIEAINISKISAKEIKLLEEKAQKYDIFTRIKGTERYEYLKTFLLERVDIMSPSILIAISGIETNWGRSRIVKEANSLYKEIAWNTTEGLEPMGEDVDKSYRIKKFDTKKDAMSSFLLTLNSKVDYAQVWNMRRLYRWREKPMQGRSMAHNFNLKSPLRNYIGLLDYTITFYQLDELDRNTKYW